MSYLDKMIDLVSSEDMPEVYSALLSHYLFEYIHPFYDGNGKMCIRDRGLSFD